MAEKFEIKRTTSGQFLFNLVTMNGEPILTSKMYEAKAGAENGIRSVKENSGDAEYFKKLIAKNGEPYFVLRAGNNKVICRSETYFSTFAMQTIMQFIMSNAQWAEVVDLT